MTRYRWIPSLLVALTAGSAMAQAASDTPAPPAGERSLPTVADLSAGQLVSNLRILYADGRYVEGAALAREALERAPDDAELRFLLGAMLGSTDDHEAAAAQFRSALEIDPGHRESLRGLALTAAHLGRPEEAIPLLVRVLEHTPDEPEALLLLGRQLVEVGRLEEAEERFARAGAAGLAAGAVELGLLLRGRGALEAAAEAFRRALAQEPDDPGALFNLGQVLLRSGRREEGRAVLERHAAAAARRDRIDYLERSSRLPGATAANFLALGTEQLLAGRPADALASLRRAADRAPDDAATALSLAAALIDAGATDEARGWAVRALLAAPESARAHYLVGLVRLRSGTVAAAEEAFERSRRLAAWSAEEHRQIGHLHLEADRPEEAAGSFEAALALEPGSLAARRGLARALLVREQWSAAELVLDAAPELAFGGAPQPATGDGELLVLRAVAQAGSGRLAAARASLEAYLAARRAEVAVGGAQALVRELTGLPGGERVEPLLRELLAARGEEE